MLVLLRVIMHAMGVLLRSKQARSYGKRSVTKLNGTFKTRKRTLETHTCI